MTYNISGKSCPQKAVFNYKCKVKDNILPYSLVDNPFPTSWSLLFVSLY